MDLRDTRKPDELLQRYIFSIDGHDDSFRGRFTKTAHRNETQLVFVSDSTGGNFFEELDWSIIEVFSEAIGDYKDQQENYDMLDDVARAGVSAERQVIYNGGSRSIVDEDADPDMLTYLTEHMVIRVTDLQSPVGATKLLLSAVGCDSGGSEKNAIYYSQFRDKTAEIYEYMSAKIILSESFRDGCRFRRFNPALEFQRWDDYHFSEKKIVEWIRKLVDTEHDRML